MRPAKISLQSGHVLLLDRSLRVTLASSDEQFQFTFPLRPDEALKFSTALSGMAVASAEDHGKGRLEEFWEVVTAPFTAKSLPASKEEEPKE